MKLTDEEWEVNAPLLEELLERRLAPSGRNGRRFARLTVTWDQDWDHREGQATHRLRRVNEGVERLWVTQVIETP